MSFSFHIYYHNFNIIYYNNKDKLTTALKIESIKGNLNILITFFLYIQWNKLSLNKKRSDNWHKQIQDMLSHSKNLFESGMEKYKQNGIFYYYHFFMWPLYWLIC